MQLGGRKVVLGGMGSIAKDAEYSSNVDRTQIGDKALKDRKAVLKRDPTSFLPFLLPIPSNRMPKLNKTLCIP